MAKINMNVILGDPGTGKSHDLIDTVLKMEEEKKSIYVFTPTGTATQRIINGYKTAYRKRVVTQPNLIWEAVKDTHVMQDHYYDEENVFIDEFSMLTLDNFYALLYRIMLSDKKIVNLTVYADEKQLEPVKGVSCLMLLFQANINNFKGIGTLGFWYYVQNMLYETLDNMELNVPENWKPVINKINLIIKHNNYRLQERNGVTGYNDSFYRELLDNGITTEKDYTNDLVDRLNKKYLIVTPIHSIGKQIDEILLKAHKNDYQKVAPFIRDDKDIWINPNCKIDYGFDFVKPYKSTGLNDNLKYSFYTTVHYCQGATVNNSVFCMLNHKLPKDNRRKFYTRNLLYVAISRAKQNSEYFGRRDVLLELMQTYPENGGNALSAQIAFEALNLTYDTVIGVGDELGHLSCDEFYRKYLEIFNEAIKYNRKKIDDLQTIDSNYKPSPFTFKKVISYMNPKKQNQFSSGMRSLGYDKTYQEYLDKSHSKGGKASKVKEWLTTLDSKEYQELKNDVVNLPMRKFKNKWKHDRRAVEKNVVIF